LPSFPLLLRFCRIENWGEQTLEETQVELWAMKAVILIGAAVIAMLSLSIYAVIELL